MYVNIHPLWSYIVRHCNNGIKIVASLQFLGIFNQFYSKVFTLSKLLMSSSDQNNVDDTVISSVVDDQSIDENDNKKAIISKDKLEPSLGDPEYYMKHPLQNT